MNGGGPSKAGTPSSSVTDFEHIRHPHDMTMPVASDLNIVSIQDGKEQALHLLKSDLMAKLNKEVKSLDEDSWMFEGPRSRIHLISGSGGLRHRRTEIR